MTELPLEYVHREPQATTDGPAPAVVVLHGRGADEEDLLPVAARLPEDHHVLSLRAPDRLMGGYTWYELDVSDGTENSQPHPEEFRRSLDRIVESVDAAVERWPLDPDALGLLGFSQGGISALATLLERPDRFAWVAALHCYLPASHEDHGPEALARTPVFVAAGATDEIIPAGRAAAAADRLRAVGADVTYDAYETGHSVGRRELADLVAFVEDATGA